MANKALEDISASKAVKLPPSTFYRNAHPDLFSDSQESLTPSLPKDLFTFLLNQLTTAKKEYEFEEFCRRLAEREICPNLIPQTGPVGGGDGKTDTSTYPVAPQLLERRWWAGHAVPSAEDWAFAISCKNDWRSKAKSDIEKIANLDRRYNRVYFMTNQPVKGRVRTELESKWSKENGVDVRILDRTWIVEKVFTNRHEQLAIESLGLEVGAERKPNIGPNDTQRHREFEELIEELRNPVVQIEDDYVLSQDYLRAAKLASSLERPRNEVDALFIRARNLALKCGYESVIVRTHYTHAWRSYFWYDDASSAEQILDLMMPYLPNVNESEVLELFSNLISVLETASSTGFFPRDSTVLERRRNALLERLTVVSRTEARPNNSLYAETIIASWRLRDVLRDPSSSEKLFEDLGKIFRRANGMGTYPILRFMEVWQQNGEFLCDLPGYSKLQAEMQQITSQRFGETSAGREQVRYGWQLLNRNHPEEALRHLSSGRFLLLKAEAIEESFHASLGCAAAYDRLGYLWAARTETLCVAHHVIGSMERVRDDPFRCYRVVLNMTWLELRLGRLAPFLAWRNLAQMILGIWESQGNDASGESKEFNRQDGCLACLLMKASNISEIEPEGLHETFRQMGLELSRVALLYLTGRDDLLRAEMTNEMKDDPTFIKNWITAMKSQPAFLDAPYALSHHVTSTLSMKTTYFGVNYEFRCENRLGPILVSEAMLGTLDAAFAAAKWENFAFVYENLTFTLTESESGITPPDLSQLEHDLTSEVRQIWAVGVVEWIQTQNPQFSKYLFHFLAGLLSSSTVDSWKDVEAELDTWGEHGVFERCGMAACSVIALCDIIGTKQYDIEHWTNRSYTSTST